MFANWNKRGESCAVAAACSGHFQAQTAVDFGTSYLQKGVEFCFPRSVSAFDLLLCIQCYADHRLYVSSVVCFLVYPSRWLLRRRSW